MEHQDWSHSAALDEPPLLCRRRGRSRLQGGASTLTWLTSSAEMACKSVSLPAEACLGGMVICLCSLRNGAEHCCREGLNAGPGPVEDLPDGERTGQCSVCNQRAVTQQSQPRGQLQCVYWPHRAAFARSLLPLQVTPILTLLDVPVRAVVAPFLDQHASRLLSEAVRRAVLPLEPAGGVWFQDSGMYHATVWHASHHQVRPRGQSDNGPSSSSVSW